MKKILCLTDFSENAYRGILYANEIAKRMSAKLVLMHTYELKVDQKGVTLFHPSLTSYTDTESRDRLNKLCTELEREDKYSKVSYEYIVKEGDVANNLNKIIAERDIDLVAFSIEGAVEPQSNYYGIIVSNIVQNAQCPVVAIPPGYVYNGIHSIAYAFDIKNESGIENDAVSFANLFDACLCLISFISNEQNKINADEWYSKFTSLKELSGYGKISFDLRATDNMIDSLKLFIEDRNADLLILKNHKRALSQYSFTKKFIFFSKIPVLVIRGRS